MLEMVKNKVYVFIIRGDSMRVVIGDTGTKCEVCK